MKKIILILTFLFVTFSPVYWYNLSSSEKTKVESAADSINSYIERKGEKYRPILLKRIDVILKRNIWEENIAIFTLLRELLENNSQAQAVLTEEIAETIIDSSDMSFTFSDNENRCSTNPCETSESFVKIQGLVSNGLIKYIEVNNYRLNSYQWSTWEYNPNIAYDNFTDGENIYSINYLDEDERVVYSEEFVIHKLKIEEAENAEPSSPVYSVNSDIPNVDENAVRQYWIDLINGERNILWLTPYTYDSSLDTTAKIWSDMAVSRWYIDHKINTWDSYYDYWKKVKWMKNNGVVCKNISRITFSESIAWQTYSCPSWADCTNALKKAVKRSFDFFMSEKGKDYDPHYRGIAQPLFETMWLGLSVKDLWNNKSKMYLTNHYCTTNTK
jgi:hypothetical protein